MPAADSLGYIRVSTDDQAREIKSSLTDQRTAIAALARKLGRTLEDSDIFEDAGYSGGTADRPAFQALLSYCSTHARSRKGASQAPAGAFGYVFVLNDSRFGRFDADEAAHWRYVLRQSGWEVKFAEADETDDPAVRPIMRAVGAAQAAEYRRNLRANTRRGGRGAAQRGLWQAVAPIGYRRYASRTGEEPVVLDNGKRKAADQVVRLGLGPENEQALVRFMFDAYASGTYTLGRLAAELAEKWPARPWCVRTVQATLRNPAYTGDIVYGRRPVDEDGQQRNVPADIEMWIVTRGAHPALIGRDVFGAVQDRLGINKIKYRRFTGPGYPLSGLIACAQCGNPYIGGGGNARGRGLADPDRHRFYKDSGTQRHACPGRMGTISKRFLEPIVIGAVARVVAQPLVRQMIAEEIDRVLGASVDSHAAQRKRLERDRARLSDEIDRLVQAVARGVLTDRDAGRALGSLRQQRDATVAEIERLRFQGRTADRLKNERGYTAELGRRLPSADSRGAGERSAGPAQAVAPIRGARQGKAHPDPRNPTHPQRRGVQPILASLHRAGARLTTTRRGGSANPELTMAALTRSRLSLTALAASPTMVQPGRPRAASTSTVTS